MAKTPQAKRTAPGAINLTAIPTIVTATPPKKGGLPERVLEGIADLTALDRVIEDLQDAKSVKDEEVRGAVTKIFLDDGCAKKAHPGNFVGCEVEIVSGQNLRHSVRAELKKSASALSDEAQRVAGEYHLPVEKKTAAHGTYVINPALAKNLPVMQTVVAILNEGMAKIRAVMEDQEDEIREAMTAMKIEGAETVSIANVPILQEQIESAKVVTTDETIPAVFKLPRDVAETILPMFSTLSVGWHKYAMPAGKEDDLTPALDRTEKVLGVPGFRAKMQTARQNKKEAEKTRRQKAA